MPDPWLPFISNETFLRITFILLTALMVRWMVLFFIRKGVGLLQKVDLRHKAEIRGQAMTLGQIASSLITILIIVTASLLILDVLKFDVTAILAGAGILGIVIGFATQTLLKDIMTGISLLTEGQYHVGDIVIINNIKGEVVKMGLRSTVVKDFSEVIHLIPNSEIKTVSIVPYGFAKAEIYLPFKEPFKKISQHLVKELSHYQNPFFLEPPQFLGIEELRELGVRISIGGKTHPKHQEAAARDLRRWLKEFTERESLQVVQLYKSE